VGSLARRLLFAPVVIVAVATTIYGGLRILRPDLYPAGDPLIGGVLHDLDRALLHVDLGCASQQPGCPPITTLWRRGAAADLWLLAGAMVFGVAGGALAGLWCAGHPRALLARALHVAAVVAYCTPVYVVGLGLLDLFNPDFGRFPIPAFFAAEPSWASPFGHPWEWLRTYLVPWLVLGAPLAGMCLRLTVTAARETGQEDYVRTAVAKGVAPGDVMRRHVGPVSFGATVSFAGVSVPLIVLNVVLVERVLSVPGFFHYLWKAIGHNPETSIDLNMIGAIALWATVLIIVLELVSDAILGRLDPRIRDAAF
jgi:peptide/nickel transport system permease protein